MARANAWLGTRQALHHQVTPMLVTIADMLAKALPEGVLPPGGRLTGF